MAVEQILMLRRTRSDRLRVIGVAVSLVGLFGCGSPSDRVPTDPSVDDSTAVGPSGGTVTPAPGVTVSVPSGAVGGEVEITVEVKQSDPAVVDSTRAGAIYDFGPDGTTFAVPVRLEFPRPATAAGDPADLLMLTTAGSGEITAVEQTQLTDSTIIGFTRHFSPFWASFARRRPWRMTVAPRELELAAGETARLEPSVTNVAGQPLPTEGVRFSSSDDAVAAVEPDGSVLGVGAGSTVIRVELGRARAEVPVTVQRGTPSPEQSSLTADPDRGVMGDGTDKAAVRLVLRDASGLPLADEPVFFAAGGGDLSAGPWQTDADGRAEATLTSTVAERIRVEAWAGESAAGTALGSVTVEFVAGPADVGASEITAEPRGGLEADGRAAATVTLTVRDANANPVADQSVFIVTDGGELSVGPWTTDSAGQARASLTSTTAGAIEVTGHLG